MSEGKPKKRGWAILFVPILIATSTLGFALSLVGRYAAVVSAVALVGIGCGAALGGYYAANNKPSTSYSFSFWLIFGGLIGTMPAFITVAVLVHWLTNPPK